MIGQELEKKIERGDSTPFFMTTNQTYNKETSSYVLDLDRVWVWNIYKRDLLKLGAKIIKSELGGRIGHGDPSEWCFMISREDYKRIMKEWEEQRIKNFALHLKERMNNGRTNY